MNQDRKILHIDMDAFFASVEQRDNPALAGKPVIVGGQPDGRGVVAACSYEARKFGVHSAMPSARAAKLCSTAIFVKPRFEAYREASAQIHKVFQQYTQLIEPLSLDEAYLDVTETAKIVGSATEVAKRIKQKIKDQTNLTASAGVSFNKFLAKIASDMDKPDGLFVIRPESAQAFIEQLEIRKFFGVGKVTERRMNELGIYTGLDLKNRTKDQLFDHFGKSASYYFNIARGVDDRPVRSNRVRKSIGAETTFSSNVVNKGEIWTTLGKLSERVVKSLDKRNMMGQTITLKVKYSDFQQVTRSKTISKAIKDCEDILELLPGLLKKTQVGVRPVRLVGVSVSKLNSLSSSQNENSSSAGSAQLGLF